MTKKPTAGMIHTYDVTSTFEQKPFNIINYYINVFLLAQCTYTFLQS